MLARLIGSCALVAIAAAPARADDPAPDGDGDGSGSGSGPGSGEVIEVTGRAPDEVQPTTYEVSADDIRAMPGAANDTLRALQALPGVARLPYSFGGLVLRGTSPRDSHVFLDGIEVPLAFHFGGVTSFYPSSLLDDVQLVNGGFGAEYGRGLGGLALLETRAPRTDRWRVGAEWSVVDASVHADGPAAGGGLAIGVRRSYLDAVLGAVTTTAPDRVLPRYGDAQLAWSAGAPRGDHGALTALLFYSSDEAHTNDVTVSTWFVRAALRWTRQVGDTRVTITPWGGVDSLTFNGGLASSSSAASHDIDQRTTIPGGLRADVVRDTGWGHLAGGLDLRAVHDGPLVSRVDAPDATPTTIGGADSHADVAMWTEALLRVGRLDVRPGLRVERYGEIGAWVVDPRLGTSVALGDRVTLRQAIGLYHQPPNHTDLDPTTGNPALGASWAVQASLGADARLPHEVGLSITGYAITLGDLPVPVTDPAAPFAPPARSRGGLSPIFEQLLDAQLGSLRYRGNVGRGRSYGVELALRRHVGRWTTWLSYTYGRALRTDDPTLYPGWRRYELDQPHNLDAVVAATAGAWRFGARLHVASGDPYTPETEVTDPNGDITQVEGAPFSARLPTFVSLDVRVDRVWTRCWGTIDAYLDVQNATDHDNPEGVVDTVDGQTSYTAGLPILPIVGVAITPR